MLVSAREAALILTVETELSRERARRVLSCGLAGHPQRTPAQLLHDEARVQALATRPMVTDAEIDDACPTGLFWARRLVDVTEPVARQREVIARGWNFSAGFVYDLRLDDPGPWFERLRDRRVPSTPGRAWSIRGWQPYTGQLLPRWSPCLRLTAPVVPVRRTRPAAGGCTAARPRHGRRRS